VVNVGGNVITATATQIGCDQVQFDVSGAPNPSTFYWSSNGGTILYNGSSTTATTNTPQITAISTGGDISVINTINSCGQSVIFGADYNPYQRGIFGLYPEYVTCGDHISVSVNTTPYDTYYRWYVNSTFVAEGSSAYNYCTCYYGPDGRQAGNNVITVEVDTYCGPTSYGYGEFFWACGYYRTSLSNVELYPNPGKDIVTVRLKELNEKKNTGNLNDIREIKILDKLGVVKKIFKYPRGTKTISMDVSMLALDIYIVEVSDGHNKSRLQLSVHH
jgi:hypothetical protein